MERVLDVGVDVDGAVCVGADDDVVDDLGADLVGEIEEFHGSGIDW